MEANFSPRVNDVISFSREEALRLGHDYIGAEHLLLGLIREGEGTAIKTLVSFGVDLIDLRSEIEKIAKPTSVMSVSLGNIPLLKQAEKILKMMYLEAKVMKSRKIGTEHLLLSILKNNDNIAAKVLENFNMDYDTAKNSFSAEDDFDNLPDIEANFPDSGEGTSEEGGEFSGGRGPSAKKGSASKSKTPVLDNFGRDLTKFAEDGKLDPVVGRQDEIERVSQILSRRKKK